MFKSEVLLIFDMDYQPIHWLVPGDPYYIPDSPEIWNILWENRRNLGGTAHLHPWVGEPVASLEDLSTFSASERGLGGRYIWAVATLNAVRYYTWGPISCSYITCATEGLSDAVLKRMRNLGMAGKQLSMNAR